LCDGHFRGRAAARLHEESARFWCAAPGAGFLAARRGAGPVAGAQFS
jgi:hypothetical protein